NYPAPYSISEFKPSTGGFDSNILTGPTAGAGTVNEISPYYAHMLVLPTGQILISSGPNQPLLLYTHTPDSSDLAVATLQPGINAIYVEGKNLFSLQGFRLNGIDEGA